MFIKNLWRVVLPLAFFVTSCSSPCSLWRMDQVVAATPLNNASRLYYGSLESFRNLQLELFITRCDTRMYLNSSMAMPAAEEDPIFSKLEMRIEGGQFFALVERLEGNQRLLIPPDVAEIIISALMNNQSVYLSVGPFRVEVEPELFPSFFSKAQRF